ncbi:MAG: hypothetical protein JNK90_08255 [Planctomycetaceae bacterium]|nr:hypothetical protein [Planctomycetaceae bacterium]
MSSNLSEAIDGIMERWFRLGANGLDSTERAIYVLSNADFENCLRSVLVYLRNSAGDDIELLPVAFEDIGCSLLEARAR